MTVQRAAQLLEAGLWLQMSGDVEGARRLFEQALKLDPTNARARELLSAPVAGSPVPPPTRPPENPFSRHEEPVEQVMEEPVEPPVSTRPSLVQPATFADDAT